MVVIFIFIEQKILNFFFDNKNWQGFIQIGEQEQIGFKLAKSDFKSENCKNHCFSTNMAVLKLNERKVSPVYRY